MKFVVGVAWTTMLFFGLLVLLLAPGCQCLPPLEGEIKIPLGDGDERELVVLEELGEDDR